MTPPKPKPTAEPKKAAAKSKATRQQAARQREQAKKADQARTVQAKADFLRALEANLGIVTKAAKDVGVTRRAHAKWLAADPEYADEVADIQERTLDFVEAKLLKKVSDLDTTAIIFYLKTKGKARGYVERVQTQAVEPAPFVIERTTTEAPVESSHHKKSP